MQVSWYSMIELEVAPSAKKAARVLFWTEFWETMTSFLRDESGLPPQA
jgi:hypothetical protein